SHLTRATLQDVRRRLAVLTPADGPWQRAELPGVPEFAHADLVDTDPYDSDEYMLETTGFAEPGTLRYGHIGGPVETLKQAPAFFDAAGIQVRQFFAPSQDGTPLPHLVVGPPD